MGFLQKADAQEQAVDQELRRLGALTADGSWAMVDASNGKTGFGQFGPQDPNMFPTTFYEVFIDSHGGVGGGSHGRSNSGGNTSNGIQAHFFSEPGTPINQLYGVWGNVTMGRNRGFAYDNDLVSTPRT